MSPTKLKRFVIWAWQRNRGGAGAGLYSSFLIEDKWIIFLKLFFSTLLVNSESGQRRVKRSTFTTNLSPLPQLASSELPTRGQGLFVNKNFCFLLEWWRIMRPRGNLLWRRSVPGGRTLCWSSPQRGGRRRPRSLRYHRSTFLPQAEVGEWMIFW